MNLLILLINNLIYSIIRDCYREEQEEVISVDKKFKKVQISEGVKEKSQVQFDLKLSEIQVNVESEDNLKQIFKIKVELMKFLYYAYLESEKMSHELDQNLDLF